MEWVYVNFFLKNNLFKYLIKFIFKNKYEFIYLKLFK